MDRQNRFFRQEIPGLSDENADTATPRDRIEKPLRDRMFAEEDGVFTRDTAPLSQTRESRFSTADPSIQTASQPINMTRRHLLRQIQNYSLAMAQATLQLDMHPGDASLLRYYNRYRSMLTDAVRTYESRYGKLTSFDLSN